MFICDNVLSQNAVIKNILNLYTFASRNLDNQPSGKSCCLHETQRKVILSINDRIIKIPKIEENYEKSVLPDTNNTILIICTSGYE